MDEKIWLLLIISFHDVLSFSETVYFEHSCLYKVYAVDTYKTYYVIWNGISVDKGECSLGFKPSVYTYKNLGICVDVEQFDVDPRDCHVKLKIDEDFDLVHEYNCNGSVSHWCSGKNKPIHLALIGARDVNISGNSQFRLNIFTHEYSDTLNTETIIFVAFLAGFIVLSTALCFIRHFSYKHCGRRRRHGANLNSNPNLPQDDSFIRGLALPPPSYSFVMNHQVETGASTSQEEHNNNPSGIPASSAGHVHFGLSPSNTTMASSSTGTLPPSYSSLQLSSTQGINPS